MARPARPALLFLVLSLGCGCDSLLPFSTERTETSSGPDRRIDLAGDQTATDLPHGDIPTVVPEASLTCPENTCDRGKLCKNGKWVLDCACCLNSDGSSGDCSGGKCTVEMTPLADTFTAAYSCTGCPCTNCRSSALGGEKYLVVSWWGTSNICRAYLRFPVFKHVPRNTSISSATMKVWAESVSPSMPGGEVPVRVAPVKGAWDENSTHSSTQHIVELSPDVGSTLNLVSGNLPVSYDIPASVSTCLAQENACTGFRLVVTELGSGSVRLSSSENSDKSHWPRLKVSWPL